MHFEFWFQTTYDQIGLEKAYNLWEMYKHHNFPSKYYKYKAAFINVIINIAGDGDSYTFHYSIRQIKLLR